MALIKCPECGKEISDKATTCPSCGCPVRQAPPPLVPGGQMPPPMVPSAPKKKGQSLLTFLLVFVLIVGLLTVVATFSRKDSAERSGSNGSPDAPQESVPSGSDEDPDLPLNVNDEGILKDWSVTVTNVEIVDKIQQGEYFSFNPAEGHKYLRVDCTVTNNGTDAGRFLSTIAAAGHATAKILYQDTYEYSSTNLLGCTEELHDTSFNPLSTKEGIIAFEIPDSVASSDEELILVFKMGRKEIRYKIR